jgi:hypothetical protein
VGRRAGKSLQVLLLGGLALLLAPGPGALGAPVGPPVGVPRAASVGAPAGAISRAAGSAPPLEPNLVALRARDVHVQRVEEGGRRIRFESGLGNVGRGPIEVRPNRARPCPRGQHHASQVMYRDEDGSGFYRRYVDTGVARRSAGCMVFHRYHDHWHFEAASRYTLFRRDRPDEVRVARRKMSFCLRDSRRVPASYGSFHHAERYGACSKYSPQGISIGWVDVYQSYLAGQAMRLPTNARDGLYCLEIKVDPKNQLVESDDEDNTSMRAFYLRGTEVLPRKSSRCS